VQGSPKAVSRDSENDDILEDSTDTLRRCKDLLERFPEILRTTIKRFRGYPEEMQTSPKAISRDFENYYILEDSEDILRRCKDLLKRFPKVLRTIIYWKIPRIS
jgi:hypothetical protein